MGFKNGVIYKDKYSKDIIICTDDAITFMFRPEGLVLWSKDKKKVGEILAFDRYVHYEKYKGKIVLSNRK